MDKTDILADVDMEENFKDEADMSKEGIVTSAAV